MNSKDRPTLTVASLLAMRSEPDAIRVISERLGVKDMGPADHIRTKHEVKSFVEIGSDAVAEALLRRAGARLEVSQKLTVVQKRGQRQAQ